MMKAILAYFDLCSETLNQNAPIDVLVSLPVRERIGRFKYVKEDDIDTEYEEILKQLHKELNAQLKKEEY